MWHTGFHTVQTQSEHNFVKYIEGSWWASWSSWALKLTTTNAKLSTNKIILKFIKTASFIRLRACPLDKGMP